MKGVDYIFYLPMLRRSTVVSSTPRIPIAIFVKYELTGSTCSANCGAGKSPTSCRLSSATNRSSSAPTAACEKRQALGVVDVMFVPERGVEETVGNTGLRQRAE